MKRYIKSSIQPLSELDWKDRYDIAKDPNTSAEVLSEIFELDGDAMLVLNAIAHNPNTPAELVDRLAEIGDANVNTTLAGRTDLSKSALKLLAEDKYYGTQCRVAKNPNVTPTILRKLLYNSEDYDVTRCIASSDKATTSILLSAVKKDCNVADASYNNPSATAELKESLIHHPDMYVRYCLARDCKEEYCLRCLAVDSDYRVRWQVAANHNTPEDVLESLCRDVEEPVRLSAIQTLQISRTWSEIQRGFQQ